MQDFGLLVRFEDQSESYTLGFEAGMIFAEMQKREPFERLMHAKNLVQIEEMADAMGYGLVIEPVLDCDEWLNIKGQLVLRRVK